MFTTDLYQPALYVGLLNVWTVSVVTTDPEVVTPRTIYRPQSATPPAGYRPLSATLPAMYRPVNPTLPSG